MAWLRIQRFEVQGLGFGIQSSGFEGAGWWVWGLGLGFGVESLGFWV